MVTYGYIFFPEKPKDKELEEKKTKLLKGWKDVKVQQEEDIVWDSGSGITFDRPQWTALKSKLRAMDKILVVSLSSFSRATFRTTLKEIESLQNSGVYFDVLDLLIDKDEKPKGLWDYVTDIYEYFEDVRLERQGTAIASITANMVLRNSKYPGRRTVLDPEFLKQLQDLLRQKITSPTELARRLEKSRSTIYKALKLLKEQEQISSETLQTIADGET